MPGRDAKATAQRKRKFLEVLSEEGRYGPAAAAIGVAYHTPFRWKQKDAKFRAQCDKALEDFYTTQYEINQAKCDDLEHALYENGMGWDETHFTKDGVEYTVRKHDTVAGLAFLNANRPDKYNQARRKQEPEDSSDRSASEEISRTLSGLAALGRELSKGSDEGASET